MKTTRRIFSLALVMILAISLVIPAMAADGDGTISVTRPTGATGTPTTYNIYKLCNIAAVEGGYTYQLTDEWDGFTAPGYFDVEADNYIIWKKNPNTVADAAAVAQLAKQFMQGKTMTLAGTVTAGGSQVVPAGYYLLVPTVENSPCGVVMVKTGQTAEVQEKTTAEGHPTVEKQVQEDSTGRYQTFNSAEFGQTIQYQTTIYAGEGAENYILHDKMDEHIEYTNDFQLLRDGNILPEEDTSVTPAVRNYTIVSNPGDGCTFHVEFSERLCSSLHDDAKIIVQYTGKLKPGAETDTAHKNETWLTFNNVPSNTAYTETFTYNVTVNKIEDKNNNPLPGATFVLKDNVGRYYGLEADGSVVWVTLDDSRVQKLETTVENGATIVFNGVDAEHFTLEEIVVPNGYTGQTNVEVSTKVGSDGDGQNASVTITNNLGIALPETGGIGTTLFYVGGAVLVLCALAALVIIKRKETNAQ